MEFRRTKKFEIEEVMQIIRQAQRYFKESGIDQWQNHYPNYDTIKNDIKNKNGYVLLADKRIVGTVSISFDGEKTYETIYNGEWLSSQQFAVIHRIAVREDSKGAGHSSYIIRQIEQMCLNRNVFSIRVDTHEKNLSMQRLLKKNDFEYCGKIYLADRSERMAFEKLL